jgi:hypothetical protein
MNFLIFTQLSPISKLGMLLDQCDQLNKQLKVKYSIWFDLDDNSNSAERKQGSIELSFDLDQLNKIYLNIEVVSSHNCTLEEAYSTVMTKINNLVNHSFFSRVNNKPLTRNKLALANFDQFYRIEAKKITIQTSVNSCSLNVGLMFNFSQFIKAVIDPCFVNFQPFDKYATRIADLFHNHCLVSYAPELVIFKELQEVTKKMSTNCVFDYKLYRSGLELDMGFSRLKGYTIKLTGPKDVVDSLQCNTACKVYNRKKGQVTSFIPLDIELNDDPFVSFAEFVSNI